MKTTLDIPDDLFKKAKAFAALQGRTLRDFVSAAIQEKLQQKQNTLERERGWRTVFGKVSTKQIREVDAVIQAEFSKIDVDEWR